MKWWRVVILAVSLASWASPALGQAADEANAAWQRRDYDTAERLYRQHLTTDSTDGYALHRLALILAWNEKYDESLTLFDRFLRLYPGALEASIDRARVLAWKHDLGGARTALDAVLANHPGGAGALRLRAQVESWAGDYESALATYQQLLSAQPSDRAIEQDRARVLTWSARYQAAADAYRALLRSDPNDLEARLGLARVLSWSSQLDSAAVVFASVLQRDPANLDAARGVARMNGWRGRLAQAEAGWRGVLQSVPDDVEALLGLGQTLLWQGRSAEGLEVLDIARALAPKDPEVRSQWQAARAAGAPRVMPFIVYESDSDGNRILTSRLVGAWNPVPRVTLRADAYARRLGETLDAAQPDRFAQGLLLAADVIAGPGWVVSGGLGAAASDAPGTELAATGLFGVQSPSSRPLSLGLMLTRTAFDATARLADTRVLVNEGSLTLGTAPSAAWSARGRGSLARFAGTADNRRLLGQLEVTRRLSREVRLFAGGNAFGFDHHSTDGYFSPEFYGLAELGGRWQHGAQHWFLLAEAAPGVQRFGFPGAYRDPGGTFRASGRVAYLAGPGRQLGISVGYSTTGMESLSVATASYRYTSVVLSGGWSF